MQNTIVKNHRILTLWQWILGNQSRVTFEFPLPDFSFLANYLSNGRIRLKTEGATVTKPSVEPALKHLDSTVLGVLQQACHIHDKPEWLSVWAEQLLRVCELRKLILQAKLLAENEDQQILKIKTLRLCLFFLNCFFIYNDARYVNVVLKIIGLDWLKLKISATPPVKNANVGLFLETLTVLTLEVALEIIKSPDWRTDIVRPDETKIIKDINLPMCDVFEQSPQVVLFSPNRFGFMTLCIAELLRIHGVKVKGIVVRRLLNPKRLVQEIRRDGYKWLYKKIKEKLLLRKSSYRNLNFETLPGYCEKIQLRHDDVAKWCNDNSCELVVCNNLNDLKVHNYLKKARPKLVVFCGGGLINEETMKLSGNGVLNCHGGLLPRYRGLDNYEWPLLEKHPDVIGCTTHLMSRYVDEGDIFLMYRIDVSRINSIKELMKYAEVYQVKLMVFTVIGYLRNELLPFVQRKGDGRQYFYMHPKLVEVAIQNLINRV